MSDQLPSHSHKVLGMRQDEVLYRIADRVKNFAVIYVCDLDQVPDFKQMYELYDPMTLMFFFRNKHMMCDFGTGNNNKLNWVLEDKQELIDILETIYRGAKKGRGLVVSPKGEQYSMYLSSNISLMGYTSRLLDEISVLVVFLHSPE
ncbi:U4/U6-U5 snRNP complex subunit dib1 [Lignoscripta atroalba]|nr:U4/U6-U5 snRNP complex subunit dib1 [Lignoscripta atroalba]